MEIIGARKNTPYDRFWPTMNSYLPDWNIDGQLQVIFFLLSIQFQEEGFFDLVLILESSWTISKLNTFIRLNLIKERKC